MLSSVLLTFGLRDTNVSILANSESGPVLTNKNYDGYWTGELFIKQVRQLIYILFCH